MLAFISQVLTLVSTLQSGLDLAAPWCGLEIRAVAPRRGVVMPRNTCAEPDTLTDLYLRWAGAAYNLGAKDLSAVTIPAKGCVVIDGIPLQSGDGAAAGVAIFDKYQHVLTEEPIVAVTWGKDNWYGIWGASGNTDPDLPPIGPWNATHSAGKWSIATSWPTCW